MSETSHISDDLNVQPPDLEDGVLEYKLPAYKNERERLRGYYYRALESDDLWDAFETLKGRPSNPIGKAYDKLGEGTWAWSIPRWYSCLSEHAPGQTIATDECKRLCYVKAFEARGGVFSAWESKARRALDVSQHHYFPEIFAGMMYHIEDFDCEWVSAIRIHTGGDFFSERYIEDWTRIVKLMPDVRFWTYTRAWRNPALIPALMELAKPANIALHLSYDNTSGDPPRIPGTKTSPLLDRSDRPVTLRYDNSVAFRAHPKRHQVKLPVLRDDDHKTTVCVLENGQPNDLTCLDCGICLPEMPLD